MGRKRVVVFVSIVLVVTLGVLTFLLLQVLTSLPGGEKEEGLIPSPEEETPEEGVSYPFWRNRLEACMSLLVRAIYGEGEERERILRGESGVELELSPHSQEKLSSLGTKGGGIPSPEEEPPMAIVSEPRHELRWEGMSGEAQGVSLVPLVVGVGAPPFCFSSNGEVRYFFRLEPGGKVILEDFSLRLLPEMGDDVENLFHEGVSDGERLGYCWFWGLPRESKRGEGISRWLAQRYGETSLERFLSHLEGYLRREGVPLSSLGTCSHPSTVRAEERKEGGVIVVSVEGVRFLSSPTLGLVRWGREKMEVKIDGGRIVSLEVKRE